METNGFLFGDKAACYVKTLPSYDIYSGSACGAQLAEAKTTPNLIQDQCAAICTNDASCIGYQDGYFKTRNGIDLRNDCITYHSSNPQAKIVTHTSSKHTCAIKKKNPTVGALPSWTASIPEIPAIPTTK